MQPARARKNPRDALVAITTHKEIYELDRERLAERAFGIRDLRHPFVEFTICAAS
jgi:hypothetical protein